jgi:hypothetical protein
MNKEAMMMHEQTEMVLPKIITPRYIDGMIEDLASERNEYDYGLEQQLLYYIGFRNAVIEALPDEGFWYEHVDMFAVIRLRDLKEHDDLWRTFEYDDTFYGIV